MPGNKSEVWMLYGFSYGMASASARRSRLVNVENEVADSYMNAFNKPCSFLYNTSKNLVAHAPILTA